MDYGHAIAGLQTFDGGFILVGFGNTANVVRTDGMGRLMWSKLIGGQNQEWWDVEETFDGFLLTGAGLLVKLDPEGNVVWAKSLPNNGTGYDVTKTSDGAFVVAGTTNGQAFLLKTDADGGLQWGWTYAGGAEARSAIELSTGGFMVLGATQTLGAGGYDLLFMETDSAGTLQWAKTAGGAGNDQDSVRPYRMIRTSDGGFVVVTSSESFGDEFSMLVLKLDAAANVTWANTYGDGVLEAVAQTPNGYFVMGTFGEEFLMALDPMGKPQWARKYGDTLFENYVGGGATLDGGAFLVTEAHMNPGPTHKILLVKTDPSGHTGCSNETSFSVTPNNVSITSVAAALTATTLSGPLSTVGVSVRDGGLMAHDLCRLSPNSPCDGPLVCGLTTGQLCLRRLPPL